MALALAMVLPLRMLFPKVTETNGPIALRRLPQRCRRIPMTYAATTAGSASIFRGDRSAPTFRGGRGGGKRTFGYRGGGERREGWGGEGERRGGVRGGWERKGGGAGKRRRGKGSRTPQLRRETRQLNGILLLDKPFNITSNDALQRVKYLFGAEKAGHTGTLDPIATGMLPICFGDATKLAQILTDSDKTYVVRAKLGVRTTTSDSEGETVSTREVKVSEQQLREKVETFRGPQTQVPSMFSAIKHKGKKLYEYARAGETVDIEPRPINVFNISILAFRLPEGESTGASESLNEYQNSDEDAEGYWVDMEIHVSKGTYIRTIVDDLGEKLDCGAHVKILRRTQVTCYDPSQMVSMNTLEDISKELDANERQNMILEYDADPESPSEYINITGITNKETSREDLVAIFGEENLEFSFFNRGDERGVIIMRSTTAATEAAEFAQSEAAIPVIEQLGQDFKVHAMSIREKSEFDWRRARSRKLRPSYVRFDEHLLPMDDAIPGLDSLTGTNDSIHRIRLGQFIRLQDGLFLEPVDHIAALELGSMFKILTKDEKDTISDRNALVAIATVEEAEHAGFRIAQPKRIIRPIDTKRKERY